MASSTVVHDLSDHQALVAILKQKQEEEIIQRKK
jgi:hypothetical protein